MTNRGESPAQASQGGAAVEAEKLVERLRERARNLYLTRQLLCSEAVLVALNKGLDGGLSDAQAVSLAAPFCIALGESGCVCGALSGAVLASGLFLGKDRPYRNRRTMRQNARLLHDAFKSANGATCCRVLSRAAKQDSKAHFQRCADLTAQAAELAARLIMRQRPELVGRSGEKFPAKRQSRIRGALLAVLRFLLR